MQLGARVKEYADRIGEFIRGQKRLVWLAAGGLLLVLLICLMAVLLGMNHTDAAAEASARALAESFSPLPVPPEELFLPGEPDFLPEILPERPPRGSWTAEEALPFWTDPGEKDSALWRDQVKTVIDELMERVP
ncbi:MAG: hypothetical protein LBP93_01900 [Treponema sp.]|jgi:hypothetical protein|nr:hypothetical protein [Treponema sp.]